MRAALSLSGRLCALFFDRELSGRKRLQAFVRNRLPAHDREAVRSGGEPRLRTLHGRELFLEILSEAFVELLLVLHLADWRPTKDTLHLYTQIVGKIRLRLTPPQNHWWNATLYVDVRGLTTRRLHHKGTTFAIRIDVVDGAVVVQTASRYAWEAVPSAKIPAWAAFTQRC